MISQCRHYRVPSEDYPASWLWRRLGTRRRREALTAKAHKATENLEWNWNVRAVVSILSALYLFETKLATAMAAAFKLELNLARVALPIVDSISRADGLSPRRGRHDLRVARDDQ